MTHLELMPDPSPIKTISLDVALLAYLDENGPQSLRRFAAALDESHTTTRRHLCRLADLGLVARYGLTRLKRYRITDEGRRVLRLALVELSNFVRGET